LAPPEKKEGMTRTDLSLVRKRRNGQRKGRGRNLDVPEKERPSADLKKRKRGVELACPASRGRGKEVGRRGKRKSPVPSSTVRENQAS